MCLSCGPECLSLPHALRGEDEVLPAWNTLESQEEKRLFGFRQFEVSCVKVGQAEMSRQGNENTPELTAVHIQDI